jgi:GTP-binding protein HflX
MNKTKKLFETAKKQETAVLVAVATQKQNAEKTQEYLNELAFLTETSGAKTIQTFIQKLERPDVRTFVGKGKLEDIAAFVKDKEPDMVIFDDDLSPAQVRNLEDVLKIKILDRSLLILNIFSQRAKTAQAKTQVELAQYQYLLPRLTRMWTHLSKQKGGIGMRGPGEKELETDRRIVNDRIAFLKEKLEVIEKQTTTRKKQRDKIVRVALVGYTNVGKSTLMRILSKADVLAENKLFATLDATVRKVSFNNVPFLLSDTVGFIRKLPTTLVEAFKSTLDEVREADILLHIVDASHPGYEEQIEVVNKTLAEIGIKDKTTIMVYNKMDLLAEKNKETSSESDIHNQVVKIYLPKKQGDTVFISAEKKEGLDELRRIVLENVLKVHKTIYPHFLETQIFWGDSSEETDITWDTFSQEKNEVHFEIENSEEKN